jgi:hypothetical protein
MFFYLFFKNRSERNIKAAVDPQPLSRFQPATPRREHGRAAGKLAEISACVQRA